MGNIFSINGKNKFTFLLMSLYIKQAKHHFCQLFSQRRRPLLFMETLGCRIESTTLNSEIEIAVALLNFEIFLISSIFCEKLLKDYIQ